MVEISHEDLPAARASWNGPLSVDLPSVGHPLGGLSLRTTRTWGTLKDAKLWLVGRRP